MGCSQLIYLYMFKNISFKYALAAAVHQVSLHYATGSKSIGYIGWAISSTKLTFTKFKISIIF